MDYAWEIFPFAVIGILVAFWLIDRWHRKHAWKEAGRWAEDYMDDHHPGWRERTGGKR